MKRIIYVILIMLAGISLLNSVHSVYELLHKRDLLIAAQQELKADQKKNQELKKQLQVVSSNAFAEQEARNKLFYIKPGEHPVFIADQLIITPTPVLRKKVKVP